MFRRAGIAILVVLAITAGCTSGEKMNPVTPAPDFSLQDLAGQHVRLADLKGKVVLLEFLRGSALTLPESAPASPMTSDTVPPVIGASRSVNSMSAFLQSAVARDSRISLDAGPAARNRRAEPV